VWGTLYLLNKTLEALNYTHEKYRNILIEEYLDIVSKKICDKNSISIVNNNDLFGEDIKEFVQLLNNMDCNVRGNEIPKVIDYFVSMVSPMLNMLRDYSIKHFPSFSITEYYAFVDSAVISVACVSIGQFLAAIQLSTEGSSKMENLFVVIGRGV
jgi:hypothetical protein